MLKTIAQVLGISLAVVTGLGGFFVVSMRLEIRPVHKLFWKTQRSFLNPISMKTAGRPGAYASVIRHTGRKSGNPYETPIGVLSTDDGFIVALPYGRSPDWFKNVLAAGSATLITEGATHEVDNPEVVPTEAVNSHLDSSDQLLNRILGIDEFLILHEATAA